MLESRNSHIDLIIKSLRNRGIIVILELKQTSDENEDKFLIAKEAVEQIIKKKYAAPYIKRNDIKAVLSSAKRNVLLWAKNRNKISNEVYALALLNGERIYSDNEKYSLLGKNKNRA